MSQIHIFLRFHCDVFVQIEFLKLSLKCLHPTSFGKNLKTTEILHKGTKCAYKEKCLWSYVKKHLQTLVGELIQLRQESLYIKCSNVKRVMS